MHHLNAPVSSFFFFFLFNTVCGLLVPDLMNLFPNHVSPVQRSHSTGSDLGLIVCFFFHSRNTQV